MEGVVPVEDVRQLGHQRDALVDGQRCATLLGEQVERLRRRYPEQVPAGAHVEEEVDGRVGQAQTVDGR